MKTPLFVKIASVLIFLTALTCFFTGFMAFSFSGFSDTPNELTWIALLCACLGILLIWWSVLLFKGRKWVRTVVFVVSLVWTIGWGVITVHDRTNLMFFIPGFLLFLAILGTLVQRDSRSFFDGEHLS